MVTPTVLFNNKGGNSYPTEAPYEKMTSGKWENSSGTLAHFIKQYKFNTIIAKIIMYVKKKYLIICSVISSFRNIAYI